jgi:hypothetical protein
VTRYRTRCREGAFLANRLLSPRAAGRVEGAFETARFMGVETNLSKTSLGAAARSYLSQMARRLIQAAEDREGVPGAATHSNQLRLRI